MKVHGNLHWVDDVTVGIAENDGHGCIIIHNRSTGVCWVLTTTATLEAELIDMEVSQTERK